MSDDEAAPDDTLDADVDPAAFAKEARRAALDALDQIDDDADPIERIEREEDIITTWVDMALEAADNGYAKGQLKAHGGMISQRCDHFNKRNVVDVLNQRQQQRRSGGAGSGSGPTPLDDWLEAHLDRVVRLETTDHTQDTLWRWDFTYDGGTHGTLETSRTKDGVTHFSWSHFRDEMYEGLGVNTARPNNTDSEDWRLWIDDLITRKGEVRETFGPRSHGVERLQDYVRDSMAFGNREDAAERNGVYLDADPASGTPAELAVLSTEVKRICDDVEIEVRALQQELDARGFTNEDVAGVSDSFYITGSMVRFWLLDPEFAEPAGYMEEAESPADTIDTGDTDDDDDDGGVPTPASADATTSTGDEGSQLSSIGPDSSDEDSEPTEPTDEGDSDDAHDAHSRTAAHSRSESDDENTGNPSDGEDS